MEKISFANKQCNLIIHNKITKKNFEKTALILEIYPTDEIVWEEVEKDENFSKNFVVIDVKESNETGETIQEDKPIPVLKDKNGGEEMKNLNFPIDCGKILDGTIALSFNGVAFKDSNKNTYIVYNSETKELINVDNFVFDIATFYKIPTGIKDIKEKDIILYNNEYIIIQTVSEDFSVITGINPIKGEKKTIVPIKNMFGFNYLVKIVNFAENILPSLNNKPDENNPFGNINSLMLFSMLNDKQDDKNSILELMMLNNFMQKK